MKGKSLVILLMLLCCIVCAFALVGCDTTNSITTISPESGGQSGNIEPTLPSGNEQEGNTKPTQPEDKKIPVNVYIDGSVSETIYANATTGKIAPPSKPQDITTNSNSEKYFYGWFTDSNFQTPYTDDTTFDGRQSLYGKWITVDTSSFKYTVDRGVATITGYNLNNTTVLVVPNFINTFPVINIADFAFSSKKTFRTVIILNGIETIGGCAFSNCNSIEYISLPSTLKTMSNSFMDCSLLKSISIPKSVNEISENAFRGCTNLESINVDENNATYHSSGNCLIETASKKLIQGCKNSIIPSDGSVVNIHSSAFSGSNIVNISIPNGIKEIPNQLFYDCSLLQEVILPDTLLEIESNAFSNCISLSAIEIPNGVTTIKFGAFSGCSKLQTISIPNTLSIIENSVFYHCDNLNYAVYDNGKYIGNSINPYLLLVCKTNSNIESCNINNETKIIYYEAFKNCTSLLTISIPSSVNTISDNAFYGCGKLETVNLANGLLNIGAESFSGCSNLLRIIIPDSITYIGAKAFKDCQNLIQVSIGSGITKLSNAIFVNCQKIKNLVISNSITEVDDNIFGYYTGYAIFYYGTEDEFLDNQVYQHNAHFANMGNCFFYSASQPVSNGNFWHYDIDNLTPVKW